MDLKAGLTLIPPSVKNSNCSHSRYSAQSLIYNIGFIETIEALLILILTLGVVGANALIIFVINNRRYTSYIPQQPRYLLTSLALNDLAIGLLITPFGLIPALLQCWPYGEIFCQIQALLRGALSQQSAVILICMAIDRYICALHPRRYQQHLSKKGCVAILSLTWIINLTIFGLLVLPKGYYFNHTGLMACEPFYSKPSYRILATCALYFPTTMVLMYCYGLSFHLSRFRLITDPETIASRPSETSLNITIKKMTLEEKHLSASTSRSMAAISLGFIVMVTPWTIQEIVTACTGSKLPRFLDFLVTWTALSNSFWNPFLYWLLNSHFRRLSKFLLSIQLCPHEEVPRHKGHCCNINSECDPLSTLPFPPPPHSHEHGFRGDRNTNSGGGNAAPYYLTFRPDVERLSEKYWGEILERTLSSGSLYALQKSLSSAKQQDFEEHEHDQQCEQEQHQHDRHRHKSINFSKTNPSIATVTEQYENHDNNNHDEKRVMYISDCEDDDDDDDAEDDGEDNDDDDNENNVDEIRKHHKIQQQHHHCQQQYQQCFNINNILKSEPKLCEHIYHDINCAKNKTPILPTMYDVSNDVSPM